MEFTMGGRKFDLTKEQVEMRTTNVRPEPIRTHSVVVNSLAYPPKQVIEVCVGFARTTFTTMEAQRVLNRLGFLSQQPVPPFDPKKWFEDHPLPSATPIDGDIEVVSAIHHELALSDTSMADRLGEEAQRLGDPSEDTVTTDVTVNNSAPPNGAKFVPVARHAAAEWHATSDALSEECRVWGTYRGGGPYAFCLPVACSLDNLLPETREISLERFRAAGIPWHDGIKGGPSNHLLSSQVQCANALAPFVADPDALKTIFCSVLPIDLVIPFGCASTSPFDLTDHVVFEWPGLADYLGEHPGAPGLRGAMNTSVDAAIRYRAVDGRTEIALIEWKYVEQYRGHQLSGGAQRTAVRKKLYRRLWEDPDGPLRHDLVPYDDLFYEPMYQLMRQQMLAWKMEQAHELDAEVVRLIVVAPSANRELATSFNAAGQRTLGEGVEFDTEDLTVHTVWKAMQRRPDRFAFLDSATLVAADSPTSQEFKHRYGHLAPAGAGLPPGSMPTEIANSAEDGGVERLRRALDWALMVLRRVADDGGVLEQVNALSDAQLRRADPHLLAETSSRLEELAELARLIRAEEIFELLGSAQE